MPQQISLRSFPREFSNDSLEPKPTTAGCSSLGSKKNSIQLEVPGIMACLESKRTPNCAATHEKSKNLDFKQEKQILDLIKTIERKNVHLEDDLKNITSTHIEFKDDKS